ncbi:hypothetical protein N8D56_05030 [Devosia sp. A8/3-2]|nr:hypothetical protein N8D56_05030 [Devosia sp. A8/3-2]
MGDGKTAGSKANAGLGTSLITAAEQEFNKGAKPYNNPLYTGIGDTTKQGIDQTVAAANSTAPVSKMPITGTTSFCRAAAGAKVRKTP